jgi:uncharacterized protein with von Willebrand factor type A (vWA) domain
MIAPADFMELVAEWSSTDARYAAAADSTEAEDELRRLASLEVRISRAAPVGLEDIQVALEFLAAYSRTGAACQLDHVALSVLRNARRALGALSVKVLA